MMRPPSNPTTAPTMLQTSTPPSFSRLLAPLTPMMPATRVTTALMSSQPMPNMPRAKAKFSELTTSVPVMSPVTVMPLAASSRSSSW